MTYRIKEITRGLADPIVAHPNEKLSEALKRMLRLEFSQLPVAKENSHGGRDYFLITKDSILNTLASFGLSTLDETLKVNSALVSVKKYHESDELFELIEGIEEHGAVLILDDNEELLHILTTYDTTIYFKKISEDIMRVRDIEHTIKDYILESFKLADGNVNEIELQATIDEILGVESDIRKRFDKALRKFLNVTQKDPDKAKKQLSPDPELAEEALREILDGLETKKPFSGLTMDTYIKLFLHEKCWGKFGHIFEIEKDKFHFLLESVRVTRNLLAHFREDEITPQQRNQLRKCEGYLGEYKKRAFEVLQAEQV